MLFLSVPVSGVMGDSMMSAARTGMNIGAPLPAHFAALVAMRWSVILANVR